MTDFANTEYFSDGDWNKMEEAASRKDEISDQVEWTRRWNPKFNLVGEVGEETYSRITGQPRHSRFGDGGEDFPGVDVKAVPYWKTPLLLRLATDPLRADFYALVAVDLPGHRARYVGYATRDELLKAGVRDYRFGPTRTLRPEVLHLDLPPISERPIRSLIIEALEKRYAD